MSFFSFLIAIAVPVAFILGCLFGGLLCQAAKSDTRPDPYKPRHYHFIEGVGTENDE